MRLTCGVAFGSLVGPTPWDESPGHKTDSHGPKTDSREHETDPHGPRRNPPTPAGTHRAICRDTRFFGDALLDCCGTWPSKRGRFGKGNRKVIGFSFNSRHLPSIPDDFSYQRADVCTHFYFGQTSIARQFTNKFLHARSQRTLVQSAHNVLLLLRKRADQISRRLLRKVLPRARSTYRGMGAADLQPSLHDSHDAGGNAITVAAGKQCFLKPMLFLQGHRCMTPTTQAAMP